MVWAKGSSRLGRRAPSAGGLPARRFWCSARTRATVLRLMLSRRAIRRREAPPYHKRITSLRVASFMPPPIRPPDLGSAPLPIRHPAPAFENEATEPLDLRG